MIVRVVEGKYIIQRESGEINQYEKLYYQSTESDSKRKLRESNRENSEYSNRSRKKVESELNERNQREKIVN